MIIYVYFVGASSVKQTSFDQSIQSTLTLILSIMISMDSS